MVYFYLEVIVLSANDLSIGKQHNHFPNKNAPFTKLDIQEAFRYDLIQ